MVLFFEIGSDRVIRTNLLLQRNRDSHTTGFLSNRPAHFLYAAGAISTPILSLADTARIISLNRDYSVRVENQHG